jgi:hypothetical protein
MSVRGHDQPGPAVRGGWLAELRGGPAEGLFEKAEGVLNVEAAQERLPAPVDIGIGGVGLGPPQPERLGR